MIFIHFKPGDWCINQLIYITHEICKSFDEGYQVRGAFLDISKAFNKALREGLLVKLKQNGISGNLLIALIEFSKDINQTVVLNGKNSIWANIEAGVPRGSILGPLSFLIYTNNLSEDLNAKLFSDDASLFFVVKNINLSAKDLDNDLAKISNWSFQWKMNFNPNSAKQAQEVILKKKKTEKLK